MKTLDWNPMTGPLDNRSIPSDMPSGSFRQLKNVRVSSARRLSRGFGWEKLFSQDEYNNQDLHDQLLSLQTFYAVDDESVDPTTITEWPNVACTGSIQTRTTGRQPLTMLNRFQSTRGGRSLLAGTESRLIVQNEKTGNWRILADGKGRGTDDGTCPRLRFYCSLNLDTAIFTNDYDKPLYWIYGSGANGCDQQAARPIPELDLIGVTKAAVTWTWKYTSFLANLEMDGQRYPNKIVWSDYKDPLSWDPSKPQSIAGSEDLDYGEIILGGAEIGDLFFIFTNRRIWQISINGAGVFAFNHRFSPDKSGDRCLFYRNTLVSTGDEIYYAGVDGIYLFSIYRPYPERVEWVHVGTGNIFHESRAGVISPAFCENHVAGFNPVTKEIFLSWVPNTSEDGFPESTLKISTQYQHVSEVDHGFTAFCVHQADPSGTLRDYLLEICACTIEGLEDNGMGFVKEGLPLSLEPDDCPTYTSLYSTVGVDVDGASVEDWTQDEPSEGALCSAILPIEDLCGECDSAPVFIAACAVDYCLKQFTGVYSRERCTNPTGTGVTGANGYLSSVGNYVFDGYTTRLVTLAMNFKETRSDKTLRRVEIEGIPELQSPPSDLIFRLGTSHQVVDPILNSSRVMWFDQDVMPLEYKGPTVAVHEEDGSRPDEPYEWPAYYKALYFYFDFSIGGTGGAFDMSRISADIEVGTAANPFR